MSTATRAKRGTDEQLGISEVAALLGIQYGSVRTYRRRGRMPEPDGVIGRSPWWWRSTVEKWDRTRPASGYNPATHANAPAKAAQRRAGRPA